MYDLNIQSNEYGKALLSLSKEEHISADKLDNLYIALANHAGKDKLTWQERIEWAKTIPLEEDCSGWDEPMLGRKALRAFRDTVAGKSTGYMMSADSTASGIQIMGILAGCRKTATLTNAIDPTKRYDLYTEVAELMSHKLGYIANRKIIKQCVMTHMYNSKATPKALLSEKELEVFYEVMEELLPGANEVLEGINDCWNPNADHHTWVMPDGHTVYVPVVESKQATYRDAEFGEIPLHYYAQQPSENYRSLAPNVIHSIDGYIAREMVRRCEFQLVHVHDCFMFNPQYLNEVRETYRNIMCEIAQSSLLENIMQQITGNKSLQVVPYEDLTAEISNSSYMLS